MPPAVLRRLASGRAVALVIAIALAVPLFLSDAHGALTFGLPRIYNGDEPHYLVMLESLVGDRDLDLRDDYDAARLGGDEAGRNFARAPLDHHTVWFAPDGTRWPWYRLFAMPGGDAPRTRSDAVPDPPRPLPGVPIEVTRQPEHSSHPAGLALLLAPLLFFLRGTSLVEPAAIALTTLAIGATAWLTHRLLRVFSRDAVVVNGGTLLAILATPVWAYGRFFVTEGWLACCATGAIAVALHDDAYVLAGVLIAIGAQMKPPFAIVALPLLADAALRKQWSRAFRLGVPVAIGASLVLASNAVFFGAPTRAAQAWEFGNPLDGALGLLFSYDHGLVAFAPAIVAAVVGWPAVLRRHAREGWIAIATFALYFALMALWRDWRGGYSYGPRLIVPVVPLAFVGIVGFLEEARSMSAAARRALGASCALSVVISAMGAVASFAFWDGHPLVEPFVVWVGRHH